MLQFDFADKEHIAHVAQWESLTVQDMHHMNRHEAINGRLCLAVL